MKIDIINNALPPRQDAIGQYTGKVAAALEEMGHEIRILAEEGYNYDPIMGVEIFPAFGTNPIQETHKLTKAIQERKPDWVLLQYNPFSYGRRGYNPALPSVIKKLHIDVPSTRIAVMAHETFVPRHVNFQFFVMALWQRPQFRIIGNAADVLFISVETWAKDLKDWFPKTKVIHMPVPSNMPRVSISRQEARERLGINLSSPVIGLFGTAHASRLMSTVQKTVERALKINKETRLVYIGPDRAVVEPLFGDVGVYTDGHVDDDEVSRRFAAMDITLSTFVDGVSSRRGSLMTSLQHGIASVGTLGKNTDSIFKTNAKLGPVLAEVEDVEGFVAATLRLMQDSEERNKVAEHGYHLYQENFELMHITRQIESILKQNT
jgi:glycosyltransferase involved in cell wall biosynthesis